MKLSLIKEVGKTIAWHDNQADAGEMAGQAIRAINAAVDALGADLSREGVEAWIRMRYERSLGFDDAIKKILDRESPTSAEEEEPRDREWDSGYNYEGPQADTEWDAHWAREDGDDERADDLEADAEFARQDADAEEEEDEKERCVTCDGTGKQLVGDDQLVFDCPDCKDEEEENVSVRETEIGGHKIKLLAAGRDKNPFGNNPIAIIEFDGTNYEVYKQGMINIWAFKQRPKLSNEDGKEFDNWMDNNWEDRREL